MAKRTANAEKRRQAKDLYCRNLLQQQEIAKLLKVTEKTIGRWKREDEWERGRAAYTTTKESELRRLYAQLAAINQEIEEGKGFADTRQADVIAKLSSAIKTLENDAGVAATIEVAMQFLDWLKVRDIDTRALLDGKQTITQLVCGEMDLYIKGLLR